MNTRKLAKFHYETKRYGLLYQILHLGEKLHIVPLQRLNDYKNSRASEYFEKLSPQQYPMELRQWLNSCVPGGEKYNIDHPITFNEKLQWLKLHDNTPIKTILSDKLLVRDWIKAQIGEQYLVPLVGGYTKRHQTLILWHFLISLC